MGPLLLYTYRKVKQSMDTLTLTTLHTPVMTNTSPADKITILQWNTYGLKYKLPTLSLAIVPRDPPKIQHLDFKLYWIPLILQSREKQRAQHSRESRHTCWAPSHPKILWERSRIYSSYHIITKHNSASLQHISTPRNNASLTLEHIFAAVSNSPSILGGDFNTHSLKLSNITSKQILQV